MKAESVLQSKFFKYVHNLPDFRYCIWSTPNGLFIDNWAVINEMNATGALKGVWDLTIQKGGKLFYIETKIGRNGLTKEQKHFKKVRIKEGIPKEHFFIYRTFDEGLEVLEKIKEIISK